MESCINLSNGIACGFEVRRNRRGDIIHGIGHFFQSFAGCTRLSRNYISTSSDSTGYAEQIGLVSSLLGAVLMLIVTFIGVSLRIFFSDKEMTA
jgi:hypothetical protein